MSPFPLPARFALLAFAVAGLPQLSGQSVLLAVYKDKLEVVRTASGSRPHVEVKGKRVVASGERFALHKVADYLPVFISVRAVKVRTTGMVLDTGGSINNQFELRAEFSAHQRLEDVFLVLELEFENGTKSLFLHEVGRLEPRRHQPLSLAVRTSHPLGSGHYKMHLFVGGAEALHSEMPFAFREGVLDRLVAKHNTGRTDAPPELFIATPPEFPRSLEKAKTKGYVRVRVRILRNGAVVDPKVVEATDPAFGESALAAVRLWRFLPMMKAGHPVATVADLPLDFDPVDPKAKS